MKLHFKKPFAVSLFCLIFIFCEAQDKRSLPPPEERARKQTEWMRTNLKLTNEQIAPVEAINLKYANKTQELINSTGAKRQKLQAVNKQAMEKDAELKKIFTADQYKIYQAKKEELKEEIKKEMKARKG